MHFIIRWFHIIIWSKLTNKREAIIVLPFGYQQFVTVFMFLRIIFNIGATEHKKTHTEARKK